MRPRTDQRSGPYAPLLPAPFMPALPGCPRQDRIAVSISGGLACERANRAAGVSVGLRPTLGRQTSTQRRGMNYATDSGTRGFYCSLGAGPLGQQP